MVIFSFFSAQPIGRFGHSETDRVLLKLRTWQTVQVIAGEIRTSERRTPGGLGLPKALRETSCPTMGHRGSDRRRSALTTTDTELSDMARAATAGLSTMPNAGKSAPAAMGTPMAL